MATGRITKSSVDGMMTAERDRYLWDDKIAGFGLKVTPAGSKVYLFQYRIGGRAAKVRRYTIGRHGGLTPEQARTEANRLSMLVAQQVDPQSEKVERQRQAIDLAFRDYLTRFRDECLKVDWPASWADAERTLDAYAVPVLRSKPLPEITRRDIRQVLSPLQGKPATARKVFAILRRLFRWAVNAGDLDASPMAEMEGPAGPPSRDTVLEDHELGRVWLAAGQLGYPFGPLVHLLILTGARREEVSALPWSELRREERVWKLPGTRAKNRHATDIPLSSLAVQLLDGLANGEKWPRRGLLFTTTGKTPVSGYSKAKSRLDALLAEQEGAEPINAWRFHDIRRTVATGMQRLGVRFEVTEAILNHVSGSRSGVSGIYQRHDWGPEKARALQAWSDHIEGLLKPTDKSNVVKLAEARA